MQTVSWTEVLNRISIARSVHPALSGSRLTAVEVASRIMRKDNYLIGLFNKELLDLSIPFMRSERKPQSRQFLTKVLEWSLRYALIGYVFDGSMVRKSFLEPKNR